MVGDHTPMLNCMVALQSWHRWWYWQIQGWNYYRSCSRLFGLFEQRLFELNCQFSSRTVFPVFANWNKCAYKCMLGYARGAKTVMCRLG